jgi:low affinity Fe/Cu permease
MSTFSEAFAKIASAVSRWTGRPITFLACILIVVVWAACGPVFHYSDTWQLIINTGTTIVTFLMVFLIQNTQNRDNAALQAKLDELIRVTQAKNEFIGIEHLSDKELEDILEECEQHRPEVVKRAEARAQRSRKAEISSARKRATAQAWASRSRRRSASTGSIHDRLWSSSVFSSGASASTSAVKKVPRVLWDSPFSLTKKWSAWTKASPIRTLSPASSPHSRAAAWAGVSPSSRPPPGRSRRKPPFRKATRTTAISPSRTTTAKAAGRSG